MRIFVTKNIFLSLLALFVVGCTWGKLPPSPEDPDTLPTYGGTTNQGYIEPMYPLSDAGIFPKDELPKSNGGVDSEKNNSAPKINKNENQKIKSLPQPINITPTDDKKIDNSIALFNVNGQSELYVRTGKIGEVGLSLLVGDLVDQVDEYIVRIGENLADLKTSENYVTDNESVCRDASGLAIVVLMVGLSEKESRYRRVAPDLLAAVKRLIAAADYKIAAAEFEAVKATLKSKNSSTPDKLKLEKVVKLKPVMKAMPNLNSNVRRLTNTETKLKRQLDKKPKQIFGQLAALAAISEGSIPNGDETAKPNESEKWRNECEQFRNAAIKANIAAHDFANGKIKYENYWSAFSELSRSCDSCHNIFYPDKKITNEE
ncbi:MAG: hypothetical protein LBT09_10555 [Planctomycetaceae bacterium]|jgi:hypothetical protein|nr:hypothetical protein [Planctomycetaceae bacterium]